LSPVPPTTSAEAKQLGMQIDEPTALKTISVSYSPQEKQVKIILSRQKKSG